MVIVINKQVSEEQHYWYLWRTTKDPDAADALIRYYEPIVQYHVNRIRVNLPKHIHVDDLFSNGYMGLYDALQKFDAKRDLKFDTYASFRVRGAILDGLRKEDRMPRSLREKSKRVEATIEQLEQEQMRSITLDEVAEALDMLPEEVGRVLNEGFLSTILSLDDEAHRNDQSDPVRNQVREKKQAEPEFSLLKKESIAMLVDHLLNLNEKEQLVISLFYYEELTLTEIGQVMGISTSRVSQIHSKALFKLKKGLSEPITV
jgi:RNA polymerase sigma factor FliA